MENPRVSIIIPVYNGANFLSQAISSAIAQDYKNKEILVINDGSTDDGATRRVAQGYEGRIRYFEKPNGGVASALNYGIQNMSGDYFSWLSHDDLYLKHKISRQVRILKKLHNPYQIIAGGYYIVDEMLKPLGLMDFYSLYPKQKLETPLFPVFHCAVNGCTLLIHKSHFDRVGLFNEALKTTQDYDMWFRMLRGQRLCYTHSIDVVSREFKGQTSKISTEHEKDCDNLWIRLFDSLYDKERLEMCDSIPSFYSDEYYHFLHYTNYSKITEYLKKRTSGACGFHYRKEDNFIHAMIRRISLARFNNLHFNWEA